MGLLSHLIWSWKKSGRLRKLQVAIRHPNFSVEQVLRDFRLGVLPQDPDPAIAAFLDLCEDDPHVRVVMSSYRLSRDDLRNIAEMLDQQGLGWIAGHFAAYSTIAYAEPLAFFAESMARDSPLPTVVTTLCDYWAGRIKVGSLRHHLPADPAMKAFWDRPRITRTTTTAE